MRKDQWETPFSEEETKKKLLNLVRKEVSRESER